MKNKKFKKIRITWNGALLREAYPYASKWEVFKFKLRRFVHRVLIVMLGIGGLTTLAAMMFAFGMQQAPTKIVAATAPDQAYPVLDRIALCESGGQQYDKTGQVLMHWNKNGTVDVGKYAINTVWFKQATTLGYDLTKLEDNKAMAFWIYTNKGTGDWSASADCWKK